MHGIWLHCQARALETSKAQKNPAGGPDDPEKLHSQALTFFQKSLEHFEQFYGILNTYTVKAITMVARSYYALNNLEEAVSWARKDVDTRKEAFGLSDDRTRRAACHLTEMLTVHRLDITFHETLQNHADARNDEESVKTYNFDEVLITKEEITWELDPFELPEPKRIDAVFRMMEELDGFSAFKLRRDTFLRFLHAVRRSYQANSFHNWVHAWSTAHAIFLIISRTNAQDILGPLGRTAAFLTMLVHDMEHPGLNSQYLIASGSPIALEFEAPSVLENMHWARAKALLTKGKPTDVLENVSEEDREAILQYIYTGIMATDMAQHKSIVNEVEARANRAQQGIAPYDGSSEADRLELVRAVVHAADLSGQGMSQQTAYAFGRGVFEEFHNQSNRERCENLEQSEFMRGLDTPLAQAKAQLGFTHYVVTPLWSNLSSIFPEVEEATMRIKERAEEIDFNEVHSWGGLNHGLINGHRVKMSGYAPHKQ